MRRSVGFFSDGSERLVFRLVRTSKDGSESPLLLLRDGESCSFRRFDLSVGHNDVLSPNSFVVQGRRHREVVIVGSSDDGRRMSVVGSVSRSVDVRGGTRVTA